MGGGGGGALLQEDFLEVLAGEVRAGESGVRGGEDGVRAGAGGHVPEADLRQSGDELAAACVVGLVGDGAGEDADGAHGLGADGADGAHAGEGGGARGDGGEVHGGSHRSYRGW